jgi:SAM-dependent methyltransferase
MGYFEWHEQPGYFADITRHFAQDAELLDVGCGSGWLGDHFSHYTGIDSSADAVDAAREKGREIQQGDVDEPLPFADASFDGVVLKDLLEHVREPTAVVAEALRVLRPGGRVFASSPDAQRWVWDDYTHRRPFTRKAFRLLFRDAGFDVEQVGYESVMPGTSIVSARMPSNRRPAPLRAAAWLPIVRRNVWLVARKP